ncbi:MAG: hypothetical protein WC527_03660 [Candidatus Margulisiibacteriota bacterium]
MIERARETESNMVNKAKEVLAMNTAQRTIPDIPEQRTVKGLINATDRMLDDKKLPINPAQREALARAIVLGMIKEESGK